MKKILIILLFTSISNYSQTDIYDYIINKNNDTIVGIFLNNNFFDLNKKIYKLSLNNIKTIKYEDVIYKLDTIIKKLENLNVNDSLVFSNIFFKQKHGIILAPKLSNKLENDFLINNQRDTIYGQITQYNQLIDSLGKKTNISTKNVIEFRKDGFHYYNIKKRKVAISDSKKGFLKLLISGNASLYEYAFYEESIRSGTGGLNIANSGGYSYFYFIKGKNNFDLINSHRFYQIIKRLLPENEQILEKIKKKIFDINDIYFIVKYFNKSMK
ncbi:hypothetical protein Q4595_16430 [Wenyingzhuangia sp. 1_MG-2023]|nr:hypothetical protein [Wenyingzhuangia sp. 1_MG-2023]